MLTEDYEIKVKWRSAESKDRSLAFVFHSIEEMGVMQSVRWSVW